jgi:hypothetical protein
MNTWISRTGQSWRLVVLSVLLALNVGFVVFGDAIGTLVNAALFLLAFAALLGWMFFGIKCPSCRKFAMLKWARSRESGRWPLVYFEAQRCPFCSSNGGVDRTR